MRRRWHAEHFPIRLPAQTRRRWATVLQQRLRQLARGSRAASAPITARRRAAARLRRATPAAHHAALPQLCAHKPETEPSTRAPLSRRLSCSSVRHQAMISHACRRRHGRSEEDHNGRSMPQLPRNDDLSPTGDRRQRACIESSVVSPGILSGVNERQSTPVASSKLDSMERTDLAAVSPGACAALRLLACFIRALPVATITTRAPSFMQGKSATRASFIDVMPISQDRQLANHRGFYAALRESNMRGDSNRVAYLAEAAGLSAASA